MSTDEFDLVVVGGGPAGATLSTFVAMLGYRVLVLEEDKHPRYQIGESLLPYTLGICEKLGVLGEVDAAGFMPKNGGVWYWGRSAEPGWGFDFGEMPNAPLFGKAFAYQVERRKFDAILIRNARRKGVDVRERHYVKRLVMEGGRVRGVEYVDARGKSRVAYGRIVADAGGNRSAIHRHAGERLFADHFRNVALFGYFKGGKRLPPPQSGSILNVTFDHGWFWYIPLRKDLTSVGAVIPSRHAHLLKAGHERAMRAFIDACPMIRSYLEGVPRVTRGVYGELRVRRDWSYCSTRFWAPGLVLVGDAACFVDPLFSSGVHLAMYSALHAAYAVGRTLSSKTEKAEETAFRTFEALYRQEYMTFYDFLVSFYDTAKSKEDYFRRAHELLRTRGTDRNAFIRLVSGFSNESKRGSLRRTLGHGAAPWSHGARATP